MNKSISLPIDVCMYVSNNVISVRKQHSVVSKHSVVSDLDVHCMFRVYMVQCLFRQAHEMLQESRVAESEK